MTNYISNLLDPVLVIIILGLLATQEEVHTCVLSKRWNNLWTSLAVLNINVRDSQAQSSMAGINALLEKITDVHTLEFHLKCTLRLELPTTVLPARLPQFHNLKVFTVSVCTYSFFTNGNLDLKSYPNLTKLAIVQYENCYCEATLPVEDRIVHLLATIPGRIEASPRTNLEMVEVKYWRFDSMVWRVMQHLMLGTGELENFRNYRVTNGYYDHPYKTYDGGKESYSSWDWGVVQFECAGLDTVHVEKSLLLY